MCDCAHMAIQAANLVELVLLTHWTIGVDSFITFGGRTFTLSHLPGPT